MRKSPLTFVKLKQILFLKFFPLLSFLLAPFTYLSAIWLKANRLYILKYGSLNISKFIFKKLGFFPIINHYYDPLYKFDKNEINRLNFNVGDSINFNVQTQLNILAQFNYSEEIKKISIHRTSRTEFYFNNSNFMGGDAEYYYSFIRLLKPKKIIEIGSGNSTLLAISAINANKTEDPLYHCNLICIEPYPHFWLKEISEINLLESKVEDVELTLFKTLNDGDILFIDSSHMIKPNGDVLYEFFNIIPMLNKGVNIHIHDIYTPEYYPLKFYSEKYFFWDEQYLLEAFLMYNNNFEILGALNYLKIKHHNLLEEKFPVYSKNQFVTTGSFWIRRL